MFVSGGFVEIVTCFTFCLGGFLFNGQNRVYKSWHESAMVSSDSRQGRLFIHIGQHLGFSRARVDNERLYKNSLERAAKAGYQGIAGRTDVDIRDPCCRDHGYEVHARVRSDDGAGPCCSKSGLRASLEDSA